MNMTSNFDVTNSAH